VLEPLAEHRKSSITELEAELDTDARAATDDQDPARGNTQRHHLSHSHVVGFVSALPTVGPPEIVAFELTPLDPPACTHSAGCTHLEVTIAVLGAALVH